MAPHGRSSATYGCIQPWRTAGTGAWLNGHSAWPGGAAPTVAGAPWDILAAAGRPVTAPQLSPPAAAHLAPGPASIDSIHKLSHKVSRPSRASARFSALLSLRFPPGLASSPPARSHRWAQVAKKTCYFIKHVLGEGAPHHRVFRAVVNAVGARRARGVHVRGAPAEMARQGHSKLENHLHGTATVSLTVFPQPSHRPGHEVLRRPELFCSHPALQSANTAKSVKWRAPSSL
jgi:hypothetical protein